MAWGVPRLAMTRPRFGECVPEASPASHLPACSRFSTCPTRAEGARARAGDAERLAETLLTCIDGLPSSQSTEPRAETRKLSAGLESRGRDNARIHFERGGELGCFSLTVMIPLPRRPASSGISSFDRAMTPEGAPVSL